MASKLVRPPRAGRPACAVEFEQARPCKLSRARTLSPPERNRSSRSSVLASPVRLPPAKSAGCLPTLAPNMEDSDSRSDSESLPTPIPTRRSVTEPVSNSTRKSFIEALDAVDTSLPFSQPAVSKPVVAASPVLNLILCLVSLVAGCLMPALVDLSRTATVFGPGGVQLNRRPPYTALSVIMVEAAFNVVLGVLAIAARQPPGGFSVLLSLSRHRGMLPLTLVYCLGDAAALYAIGSGGGLLYMAVSNARLLFAAVVSHFLLGRRQSTRQWLLLSEITAAAGVYAALGCGKDGHAATAGLCWALLKAFLSGLAAVLTEMRYKRLNLWHANTLLKMQSLVVVSVCMVLSSFVGEDLVLCDELPPVSTCIDRRGWDLWTWAVLVGEVGCGWLSVAILTRMSAIAKFVCKTATAPTLYLVYCATGFGGTTFQVQTFLVVTMIAVGIMAYVAEPYYMVLSQRVQHLWVSNYASVRRSER